MNITFPTAFSLSSKQSRAVSLRQALTFPVEKNTDVFSPVHFGARGIPIEQQVVDTLIHKCIIADGCGGPDNQFSSLTPHEAFMDVSQGMANSFNRDPNWTFAAKKEAAAYQHLAGLMAKGLKVDLASLKSLEELQAAYLNRFKQVAGEGVLATALRLKDWDGKYYNLFDRYVDNDFIEPIDRSFRSSRSKATKVLWDDYSYANGIVKYLHAAIIGVESPTIEGQVSKLGQLRYQTLYEALQIPLPTEKEFEAAAQEIFSLLPKADKEGYEAELKRFGAIVKVLKQSFPDYFGSIQEDSYFGFTSACRDLGYQDDSLVIGLSYAKSVAAIKKRLKRAFGFLPYTLFQNKAKTLTPAEVVKAFNLPFNPKDEAGMRDYFKRKGFR